MFSKCVALLGSESLPCTSEICEVSEVREVSEVYEASGVCKVLRETGPYIYTADLTLETFLTVLLHFYRSSDPYKL
jgi:hypothetical protein